MDWSPLDLKNLSALFDDVADAVLAFRINAGPNLPQSARTKLTAEYGQLVSASEALDHLAVQGALTGIDADVKDLQSAKHDAIAALQTITDVQKIMGIAVAAVALAASIVVTPTPGTIGAALILLVKQVKDATSTVPGSATAPTTSS